MGHTLGSLVKGRVLDNVSVTSQLANDTTVVFVDEDDLAVSSTLGVVVLTAGGVVPRVVLFQRARWLGWGSAFEESGALGQDGFEGIVVFGRDVLVKGDSREDAAVGTQVPARDQV